MSNSLSNRFNNYNKNLKQWINFLGLPEFEPKRSEIESVLVLEKDEIQKLSSIQIFEYAFMLSQYSLFLQQKSNECQAFLNWACEEENLSEADRTTLRTWVKNIRVRLDRIFYLSKKIDTMIQCLSNIGRSIQGKERTT